MMLMSSQEVLIVKIKLSKILKPSTEVEGFTSFFHNCQTLKTERANNGLEFLTLVTQTVIVTEISSDSHVSGVPGLGAVTCALLYAVNGLAAV